MSKPIILQLGSHSAVGSGLAVARAHWAQNRLRTVALTLSVTERGNTIASLTYAGRGKGPEPQQINFYAD